MRDVSAEIRRHGADLAVVGTGTVEEARAFADARALPFPLYTDPTRDSYRQANLRRGILSSVNPRIALHALRAFRQGHRQTATQGDPLQQGGVFVIAPGGRLLFAYRSREAGDHPDPRDILRALAADAETAAAPPPAPGA